jgi:hypothetical protein
MGGFDESSASGITFPLQNVIKGWTEEFLFSKKAVAVRYYRLT